MTYVTDPTGCGPNYGLIRQRLRHWWYGSGQGSLEFCGIYNDGRHLFIEDKLMPGSFFKPPAYLWMFSHQAGVITVNNIWLAHRGHEYGLLGGNACVTAFDGRSQASLNIPPFHLAYIIRVPHRSNIFHSMIVPMPLPRNLLVR